MDIILEQPIEFWNVDPQFGRAKRYGDHPTNLPTMKNLWILNEKNTILLIITMHLHCSILFMLTHTTNLSRKKLGESVIFQPVLQAYPTHHPWIITAHVSLGHQECHWKAFNGQLPRTWQLLHPLDQQLSIQIQQLSILQVELSTIVDIYNSGKTTIISAIKLLQSNPSFDRQSQPHICCRRSLLSFLGDALCWLTWTATTKDINSIKTWINQIITTESSQQETLVHIISILNATIYATQVNRHSINTLMDAARAASHDINKLYNLTTSLTTSINFHQLMLHIRSVFANPCDLLNYIQMASAHTMDYIDTATSGTLSPHVLPVVDLQKMLSHIADALPPMLHLLVLQDDTLHFYRYLCTHVLIRNKQFLLLFDMPIQDRSQQITIHDILTLSIPYGNYSACYDINTKYLGITKDETMVVELSTTQFWVCQEASNQFCSMTTPFQPLANPPSCIAALYAKSTVDITSKCSLQIWKASGVNLPTQIAPGIWILTTPLAAQANTMTLICPKKTIETIIIWKPVHILKLPTTCSTTSSSFYLVPRYETPNLDANVSINMANLHMINISAQDFCIWQHLRSNRSKAQLQHLSTIPSIPVHKIHQHMLNNTPPIMPLIWMKGQQITPIWSGLCFHIQGSMLQV